MSRAVHLTPAVVLDGLLTLGLLVLTQVELRSSWDDGFRAGTDLDLAVFIVPFMVAPFALRSAAPVAAWGGMLGGFVVPSSLVLQPLLFWGYAVPLAVTTYTVARRDRGLVGRWAFLTGPALLAVVSMHTLRYDDPNDAGFAVLLYAAAWALGRVLHHLERQGEELAMAWAELASAGAARRRRAVEDERRRLAAEMHDVVAHAAGLSVLQTGAARLVLESQGVADAPVQQLREAESTGREALDELRRLLGLLQHDARLTADSGESRS